ncbi:MAG: hypothetical protein KVP17_000358 [Porospora cf. gigantea B]|uniref:uncharacterized protein n=1 Tax=Porospora cf. gigantea B TaxID=2853592 RepID=UPI0035718247|nr:MAG: hypothetical protein KVP17_000358 [Porospora cf. gigantea B]
MTSLAASRLLNVLIGNYVEGISGDTLEIGWLKGDVALKRVSLKPEAFTELPASLIHGNIEHLRVEFGVKALLSDVAPRVTMSGLSAVFHLGSGQSDPLAVRM